MENVAAVMIEVHIGLKPDVDGRLSLSVTLDVGIDVPSQACGERVDESASTVRGYPDAIRGGIDATLGFPDDV